MRKTIGVALASLLITCGAARVRAADNTIAASSTHTSPVIYRSVLPLTADTADWTTLSQGNLSTGGNTLMVDVGQQKMETIAFKPMGGNAMCDNIKVTYDDNSTQVLNLTRAGVLNQDQLYEVAFGVDPSHVTHMAVTCHAFPNTMTSLAFYGKPNA